MNHTHSHHHDPRIGFFNQHAPQWGANPAETERTLTRLEELKPRLGLRAGMDVLEVGCGTGTVTGWLIECAHPGRVVAVDFSPAMLAHAQARQWTAEFRHIDICHQLPGTELFDVAFCFRVFPHFREPLTALRHLRMTLKPDGRLLVVHLAGSAQINEFHRRLDGPVRHDHLPSASTWPSLLQSAGLRLRNIEDTADLFLLDASL